VENMADIVIGTRLNLPSSHHNLNQLSAIDETLVDSFLKGRLGVQLLCDHYVSLDKEKPGGGISVDCPLSDVVTDASTEAKHICDANYGIAPEVHVHHLPSEDDIKTNYDDKTTDADAVTLVRPWVHHALCELFKNAMGSSIQKGGDGFPPDVHVVIRNIRRNHQSYVTCEIIDQGIGLTQLQPQLQQQHSVLSGDESDSGKDSEIAFKFATSSSQQRWDRLDEQQSYAMVRAPIASLGVGLTLSRMMMNMFGGNIYLSTNKHRPDIFHAESLKNLRLDAESGCTASLHLPFCDSIKEWDMPASTSHISLK